MKHNIEVVKFAYNNQSESFQLASENIKNNKLIDI